MIAAAQCLSFQYGGPRFEHWSVFILHYYVPF